MKKAALLKQCRHFGGIVLSKFLISLILIGKSYAADALGYSCFYKLSMNDCISCFEGLNYSSSMNNCTSVIIVQEAYKDQLDEIREVKLAGKPYTPIIASDSFYNSLKGYSTSSFHLFKQNEEIFSCALKTMPQHIDEIKQLIIVKSDSIPLKSRLPTNFRWSVGSNALFMYDQNFYTITVILLANPSEAYKIKNNDQLSAQNYRLNLDSTEIIRVNNTLAALRLPARGRIEDMYTVGDTCYFIIQNNYPIDTLLEGRVSRDTLITSIFSLIKSHTGKIVEITPIKNPYHNSNYSFIQYSFFVLSGVPYFSMSNSNPTSSEKKFLAQWTKKQNQLRFDHFMPFELPEIHKSQKLGYNFASFEYHYPYLMNKISNELYNIKTGTVLNLPLNYLISNFSGISQYKVSLNYVVADFSQTDDTLKVITREFENFYLYYINLQTNKIIDKQKLLPSLERIDLAGEPKFFNNHTICYIHRNSAVLYFKYCK